MHTSPLRVYPSPIINRKQHLCGFTGNEEPRTREFLCPPEQPRALTASRDSVYPPGGANGPLG